MNPEPENDVVLEVRSITKRFPGVLANDDVSFSLRRGQIMALLGENGAGKSTLMNVIYGLYHQDEGDVIIKGREVHFTNPREAIHSGIGMVHQHFQLVDVMTVAENVVLGEEREVPGRRNLFLTVLFALLTLVVGFQLTYENSIIFELFGSIESWVPAQTIMFDMVVYLLLGFTLLFLGGLFLARITRQYWGKFMAFLLLVFTIFVVLTDSQEASTTSIIAVQVIAAIITLGLFITAINAISQAKDKETALHQWWSYFVAGNAVTYTVLFLLLRHPFDDILRFIVPLAVATALSAAIAWVVATGQAYLFDRWERVSSVLRVVWGLAWRLCLIGVAIWLGGLIYTVSQMGLITVALENDPDITEHVDISSRIETPGGYGKAGVTSHPTFSVNWGRISRDADSFEEQIDVVLQEIETAFRRPVEYTSGEAGTVTATMQSNSWSGLNPTLVEGISDLPPVIQDVAISLLLILFGFISIRTWRGEKMFPSAFELSDYFALAVIVPAYLVVIALITDELGDLTVALFVLGGMAVYAATIYFTQRYRQRHAADILPIYSIDTAIDALTSTAYASNSVRDTRKAARQVRDLSRQYNLEVDPDVVVEKLPVGLQQRVEIIKALYRKADILILDEPTAVLTPQEGRELFRIMRDLSAQGVSIIFITHKLKEVFEVADSIVVMRGGRVVGTTTSQDSTEASLAEMMVGREVLLRVEKDEPDIGQPVLQVIDLNATDDRGAPALKSVSFDVCAGEVLGIAGVQGNGQSELVEVITGLRQPDSGGIELMGVDLRPEEAPAADPIKKLLAVLIDLLIVGTLAVFASSFGVYLARGPGGYEFFSSTTLIVFLIFDALLTIIPWQSSGMSLGMALAGIQLEESHSRRTNYELVYGYFDDGLLGIQFGNFTFGSERLFENAKSRLRLDLVVRYLLYTLMRLSVVGYVASIFAAGDSKQTWYDDMLGIRVVEHDAVTPRKIKNLNASHVPEDRLRYGLVKPFTIAENLILNDYYQRPYAESPTAVQTVPLFGVYGVVFGVVFFVLGSIWIGLWEGGLWTDILDSFEVPSQLRGVPTDQALDRTQAMYMDDPLLVALLSLLVTVLVFGLISHIIASIAAGATRRTLNQVTDEGGLVMNADGTVQHARNLIRQFDIRTPSPLLDGGSLSGGNQQKLVVAREFSRQPRLLIASQPTRGIDVGSIEFIHRQIIEQRDQGAAVLLVSAELDEVMSLSDRIAVMYQGEIIDIVPAEGATREQLGLLMAGVKN